MRIFLLFMLAYLLGQSAVVAQDDSLDIATSVWMDSVVITASESGFDVDEFIRLVREDSSFYQAFRNIRTLSYRADNHIQFWDKKGRTQAIHQSITQQTSDGRCRSMEFLEKEILGNYYKGRRKKKLRYYTAKMYERLFFTYGTACQGKATEEESNHKKGVEKYVSELKTLIFQPGEEIDVPIIGGKTAIFSDKMRSLYDFSITSRMYQGIDCYVFTAKLKEEHQDKNRKAVVRFLETFFTQDEFQVMGRNYTISYSGLGFLLDIDMSIQLQKLGTLYVPDQLHYKGIFNVPMKRKEIAEFKTVFSAWEVPEK